MKKIIGYSEKGLWWFRIFGYGLHWKRISEHNLLFSERNGYRGLKINNWFFKILKPWNRVYSKKYLENI